MVGLKERLYYSADRPGHDYILILVERASSRRYLVRSGRQMSSNQLPIWKRNSSMEVQG